jgi:glycine/D-amino acid oxidase-like deaminating enzyme/nitrite reductase/ring-hydroxylating ferredoxin subunit
VRECSAHGGLVLAVIDRMKHTIANDSGATISTWMEEQVPTFEADLPADLRPDVVVIGAGIAGLSVALSLVTDGLDVVVLDQGAIGGGQTARTSAHLASALDDHFHVLEKRFGKDGAKLAAESHATAIDAIEMNTRSYGIDCDFRRVDGYLWAPEGESRDVIDKELAAARRAGLVVDKIARAPLPFDTGECLVFANQAEFHPVKYLRGLADAIVAGGGRIFTGVHVAGVEAGAPVHVVLGSGRKIEASAAVDTTATTITSMVNMPTRAAAYRTYVMSFDVPTGYVPHALYWDTPDPYHYIRVASAHDGREVLLVGGEDHRVGQGDPERAWPKLEAWTREHFPGAGPVASRWSGQVMEPADGMAYIGALPRHPNIYVATGDSGNGLTHGTIAGLMIPSLIENKSHPWEELYAPNRSRLRGITHFVKEAMSSNLPYADWVAGGDVPSIDDIKPGQGATLRRGLHLLAVYRDESGACHAKSARCPHMSGVVRWNQVEQTWDCPCHGSRFDAYGRVLNGPAVSDLGDAPEKATGKDLLPAAAKPKLA